MKKLIVSAMLLALASCSSVSEKANCNTGCAKESCEKVACAADCMKACCKKESSVDKAEETKFLAYNPRVKTFFNK